MPGYSGTPLPKKLGIKAGFRVWLASMPAEVRAELREALSECTLIKDTAALDFAMMFTKSRAELTNEFPRIAEGLAPAGMLWVSWPKKSSGVANDLDENIVRSIGLDAGLVDVKVCAVTEVWSGLKFVRRVKDRPKKATAPRVLQPVSRRTLRGGAVAGVKAKSTDEGSGAG
jgi:hypothetical protein